MSTKSFKWETTKQNLCFNSQPNNHCLFFFFTIVEKLSPKRVLKMIVFNGVFYNNLWNSICGVVCLISLWKVVLPNEKTFQLPFYLCFQRKSQTVTFSDPFWSRDSLKRKKALSGHFSLVVKAKVGLSRLVIFFKTEICLKGKDSYLSF